MRYCLSDTLFEDCIMCNLKNTIIFSGKKFSTIQNLKNIFQDKMELIKTAICNNYCKIFFAIVTLIVFIFSIKINNKMNRENEMKININRTNDSIIMNISKSEHDKVLYLENIYRSIIDSPKDSLMLEIKRNLNNIYWRVTRIENMIERNTIK